MGEHGGDNFPGGGLPVAGEGILKEDQIPRNKAWLWT